MVRLMIVEDDPMVMQVNSQFVERVGGFDIVAKAANGKLANEQVDQARPDLVLLDFYLPDTNGIELLKEWRRKEKKVDVILITATGDPGHIQSIFRWGAVDYIIKPFHYERLKQSLLHYLSMLETIKRAKPMTQDDVDLWKMTLSSDGTPPPAEGNVHYPKGVNVVTLKQIIQYLHHHPDEALSAEDVAHGTSLARVTVRRYLEYLERTGTVSLQAQYGSVGRPIHRYQIRTGEKRG
jgi:two-component system response regulator DctR